MKFFFKNKKGMTYVELLVAFTLLVLIIFVFSPMVLSSYEWLYKAGAMNESTYEAKSVLERDLASRFSENVQQFNITLKQQGTDLVENIAVNGRKIVAETESKLETLFFGGRARLTIVSSKVVPDDTSSHKIIVKTANIPWENSTDIVCQSENVPTTAASMPEGKVYINAYAPTFSGTLEADMYSNYDSELITPITAVPSAKLIRLQVNGVDFTNSPIKIVATFKDEKGKLKSAEDFLYIEVPTLIMAGKAGEADYYTTAGLIRDDNGAIEYTKTVKDENGVNTDVKLKYSFALESRTMQIDNSLYSGLKTVRGTASTINDIQYYNEEKDYANGLKPYYVLVGSNGGIFRTYGYTKASGYNMDYTLNFNGVNGTQVTGSDVIGGTHGSTVYRITAKKPFSIESTGSTVFPQFWSGDYTHHFGYATYDQGKNNYASSYSQGAWYTENTTKKGSGNLSFAGQARYSMYFDGLNMSGDLMRRQKLRKMSYCLIDFDNDYLYKSCKYKGLGLKTRTETMKASALRLENSIKDSLYSGFFANWEKRAAICKEDTNTKSSQNKAMSVKTNDNDTTVKFSFIGIKEFSSVSGEKSEFYLDRANDSRNTGRINDTSATDVMLTASYYDPSLGNVVYLGTVHAYASVYQADNLGTASLKYNDGKDHIWVDDTNTPSFAEAYNDRPSSWPTFYLIKANGNNDGAFIYKVNSSAQDEDKTWAKFTKSGDPANNKNTGNGSTDYHKLTPAQDMSKISSNIGTANSTAAHNFFGKRDSVDNVKGIYINDLQFTFGFSSYWESLYGSLVYSGTTENYRSYEAEYYESYYGDSVWNDNQGFPVSDSNDEKKPEESLVHAVPHSTKGDVSQFNKVTNDYYNVWFPGEMYNLTQADTKDGITVAVGYAVGASCYQFVNPSDYCSLSTAMGGVFNDGVLAVKKSDATSFDTKLYYKENSTFDATSLTSQTNYGANSGNNTTLCGANIAKSGSATNDNKNYGTHARNSVRFTAVALGSETIEGSNKEDTVINYYAYYGDNYGRVWKSLVATRSGGNNTNVVKNIKYGQGANTSAVGGINGEMTEVKYGGKSFSNYFTAIETITINNDGTMVITGAPATANNYIYTKYSYTVEGTGSTEDTVVEGEAMVKISNDYSSYKIQDCVFVNEVLYCVGTVKDTLGNDASGFVFAMPATEIAKGNFKPEVITVTDPLYAIAGRVVA